VLRVLGGLGAARKAALAVVAAVLTTLAVPAWAQLTETTTPNAGASVSGATPVTIIDDRGRTVQLLRPPQRIVSLLPSLTEMVCALQACSRLVAVDRSSNFPTAVKHLPNAGGLEDANVELIVALMPDLVLLGSSARVIDRLERSGLTVVALEPKSQAQAKQTYLKIGAVLAVPEAPAQWRAVEDALLAARDAMPPAAVGARTYIEVASDPYAAGEASFMGELLTHIGWRNVVPTSMGPFPKLNPEWVVQSNPAVIVTTASSAVAMRARPGWSGIDALKQQRVCELRGAEADAFSRPGPRLPDAAWALVRCAQSWVSVPATAR
jgi:iron complex transport system substrate-binding protein